MKKLNVLAVGAVITASSFMSSNAIAGASANIGFLSDYYYRGVKQADSTGSVGLDYEHDSGLYIGTWLADVGGQGDVSASDGIEFDLFAGYAGNSGKFTYGLGYTSYQYTGDFDSAYNEVNLTAGYDAISFEFSSGTHDEIVGTTVNDKDEDYTFIALSYEFDILTATYGVWGGDLEGAYFELALAKEFSGIDFGASLINGDAEETPSTGARNFATDGTALVFSIGKSFDL